MGRAASKSYFQDSSLHSADISTTCWCLSFHLCTTISCPLHQVKNPQNKNKTKKETTQPLSSVTSTAGVRPERVGVLFHLGGNHANLDSSLCLVWERGMFPGSSSLESILHPGKGQAAPISSSSSAEKLGMLQVGS